MRNKLFAPKHPILRSKCIRAARGDNSQHSVGVKLVLCCVGVKSAKVSEIPMPLITLHYLLERRSWDLRHSRFVFLFLLDGGVPTPPKRRRRLEIPSPVIIIKSGLYRNRDQNADEQTSEMLSTGFRVPY